MQWNPAYVGVLMNDISTIVLTFVSLIADAADAVISTPILLIFIVVPLVGLGVGLFKRLINVN